VLPVGGQSKIESFVFNPAVFKDAVQQNVTGLWFGQKNRKTGIAPHWSGESKQAA
jgi:hypothetical protein